MSVEEVVAKAKAIAAKLSAGDSNPASVVNPSDIARAAEVALLAAGVDSGSGKRKRWGVTPDDKDNDTPEKRIKHDAHKRMWISTSNKPASHYRLFWELHGPSITRQVSSGEISLRLEGRGSSKVPALPGIPEQVRRIFSMDCHTRVIRSHNLFRHSHFTL